MNFLALTAAQEGAALLMFILMFCCLYLTLVFLYVVFDAVVFGYILKKPKDETDQRLDKANTVILWFMGAILVALLGLWVYEKIERRAQDKKELEEVMPSRPGEMDF